MECHELHTLHWHYKACMRMNNVNVVPYDVKVNYNDLRSRHECTHFCQLTTKVLHWVTFCEFFNSMCKDFTNVQFSVTALFSWPCGLYEGPRPWMCTPLLHVKSPLLIGGNLKIDFHSILNCSSHTWSFIRIIWTLRSCLIFI